MDLNYSNNENIESFKLESLNLDYGDEERKLLEEETGDSGQKMKFLFKELETQLDNVKKYANLDKTLKIEDVNKMFKLNNNNNDKQLDQTNDQKILIEDNNLIDNENDENDEDNIKFKEINFVSDKNNNNNNNDNNFNNDIVISPDNSIDKLDKNLNENPNNNDNANENNLNEDENENDNEKPEILTSVRVNNFKELDDKKNSKNINQEIQEEMIRESKLTKNQPINEINGRREQEMIEIEEMKKKQEEEFNKKEEEFNKMMEELKQKEEEIKKREEELNNQIIMEKERKKKEEEERIRRMKEEEDDRRRKEEEEQRRKEQEEEEQRERILQEEEDRLKKEEKEKEEEERRENDRIKKERLLKEQKEKEEEERKKIEEEKKKKEEKQKKEEELQQEKELKEQMNNIKDEVEIVDIDDDIEELEEEVSYTETSNFKSRIKQSITKSALPKNNLNSINQSLNDNTKFKSQMLNKKSLNVGDSTNSQLDKKEEPKNINNTNNKTGSIAKSINLKNKPLKNSKVPKVPKSEVKKSDISEDSKKPKQGKEPEKEIKDKSLRDSQSLYDNQTKFEHSDIFKKLTEEMRNKILDYIKNVEEFDIAHPNLDDANDYPFIDKFEKDEKPLSEIIPEYEEKFINFYDEEYLEKKVKTISSGLMLEEEKKVEDLLIETANIPNETHIELIQKNFEKEKLKNLPKTEDAELNDLENLEKKLFEDEEFLPEFNCPFSKLEDLQTFIYKYSAHENPKLMGNSINNFNNWRMTLSDGNSFYRVNMFAIIENCIFESNSELLSAILNEMTSDKFILIYKNKNIEYEKPFNILSAILALIVNGMEDKAYDLFLKAYTIKSGCFDLLLIVYLKRVLFIFSEEINKLLEDQKKTSKDKESVEKAIINLEEIDNLYVEPKINMFYLMTFLFDININILLVYDKFLKPQDGMKKIINEEENASVPTFIFGYFFSSYHILYQPNFSHKIFKEKLKQDNPKITQLTFIPKEKTKCNMCKKESKHIVFLRKKFIVCESCLKYYITNEIINERKAAFIEEKCFGKEYYSRAIHLQGDFYLDDYEYIEIFEEYNIINEICKNLECYSCQKSSLNGASIIKFKCGCTYCSDCFEKVFNEITLGNGYLLDIEIKLYNNKNFTCKCKKKYYYQDLVEYHEKNEDEIRAANERKVDYIKKYCMSCFKDLVKENKIKKIKMRKETNILDHFMCSDCYNLNFKEKPSDDNEEEEEEENEDDTRDMAKESNSKIKIVNKDNQTIHCNICTETHKYIEDSGNCGCLIY